MYRQKLRQKYITPRYPISPFLVFFSSPIYATIVQFVILAVVKNIFFLKYVIFMEV